MNNPNDGCRDDHSDKDDDNDNILTVDCDHYYKPKVNVGLSLTALTVSPTGKLGNDLTLFIA